MLTLYSNIPVPPSRDAYELSKDIALQDCNLFGSGLSGLGYGSILNLAK